MNTILHNSSFVLRIVRSEVRAIITSRLTVAMVFMVLSASSVAVAQSKPLSEEDVLSLVKLGIDDAAIQARVEKGGISFSVDDAAMRRLKDGGVSDAVIDATKRAGKPAPEGKPVGKPPVAFDDVMKLVELGVDEKAILERLQNSPALFVLGADQVARLKKAGASSTLIAALQQGRTASASTSELVTDIAVILDCSGSMREKTVEGQTKMAVAQKVTTQLIENIPDDLAVTFVVYGHEAFSLNDPRNCAAVKVVRPLSPLDAAGKSELMRVIAALKPTGATPIALSLKTAGAELAKNNSNCGLILISDGKETCDGDPVGEAALLAKQLKITFGVNVVGFDVGKDRAGLEKIAEAGKGRYYNAESAKELADAIGAISKELDAAVKPPKASPSARRAIKVLKPGVEFPGYSEIRVIKRGLGSISVVANGKYGEEIRIPSSTDKYEILWVPKAGEPVAMLRDFTLTERKVVEIRPEEQLGMIRVNGKGAPKKEILVYVPGLGSINVLQRSTKFGEVMVVPAVKVNVRVDDQEIEEGLQVEAGTLHELE